MSSTAASTPRTLTADDVRAARFQATKFREGYDQDEVDRMLDRVAAALTDQAAGRRPGLSADDVLAATFQATKFREGYDQDEVDDFLDEVVTTLRGGALPGTAGTVPVVAGLGASALRAVPLQRSRFGARYEPAEVDAFVARAATALEERDRQETPSLQAGDVHAVRFASASGLRVGYDRRQVDDLLRTVARALDVISG